MHVDAKNLEPDTELQAEVAVVGAGPAGIVLALELANSGHSVVLLESGGKGPAAQPPPELVRDDPFHVPMSLASRRQVGGASTIWGGRCVPFDPVDFDQRELVGDARWPVTYADIAPFFPKTCDWCQCGDALFDAEQIPALADRTLVPGLGNGEVRATSLERWSRPTNFGREYYGALKQARTLRLVTNLTCVEIVCRPGGSEVDHLEAVTPEKKRVTVRASRYVLACGGLETTRLLFASNRLHPEGLGNHSGHLGRWYMAHVECRIGRIHFTTPPGSTIYGYERDPAGVYVRRRFTFAPELLVNDRLPNCAMWFVNPSIADATHRNGGLSFVYLMLRSALGRTFTAEGTRQFHLESYGKASRWAHMRNVIRDIVPTARFAATFGYKRFLKRGRKVPGFFMPSPTNTYPINYHGEHLPSRDSYVAPSNERDELGMPRLRTHLSISDEDVDGAIRSHQHLDRYLREHRLGHIEYLYDDPAEAVRDLFVGGYHQAGTTRMSAAPEDGVVDQDLAVHGVKNLYTASSSAFVTSGQASSTFMIVAFAVRLAEHLRALGA